MSNRISIRRGETLKDNEELDITSSPLLPYELGYCIKDKALFIGVPTSSGKKVTMKRIGGSVYLNSGTDWLWKVNDERGNYTSMQLTPNGENQAKLDVKGTLTTLGNASVGSLTTSGSASVGSLVTSGNASVGSLTTGSLKFTSLEASSKQLILNMIYPVGAIYISVTSTSPASLFGGTWEAIGGRFLLGVDSTYTAGSTGGSKDAVVVEHTHECASNGYHTHGSNPEGSTGWVSSGHTHSGTTNGGGGHSHNIGYDSDVKGGGGYSSVHRAGTSGAAGWAATSWVSDHTHSFSTGGISANHWHSIAKGGSHSHAIEKFGESPIGKNMPPYLTVYMWKRTV